jgi:hypothetical protein
MKQQRLKLAAKPLSGAAMKQIKGGDFPPYETFVVCTVADWGCFYTLSDCEANCALPWACRANMTGCPVGMP